MDVIDQATDPRESERLDVDKLQAYLETELDDLAGPIEIQQFRKGHSNLTYLVTDGDREWVLRRPPFGTKVKSAHDMGREWRILKGLHRAYPQAPRAVVYTEDESIIGAPFYMMERLRGVILRSQIPKGVSIDAELAGKLCEAFVDNFVAIHSTDLELAGLADLGRPEGYIRRQVEGWTKRYYGSQTDEIDEIVAVAEWLADKMPDEHDGVLIHNDYKFDNIVLDPDDLTQIVGVLDWEMTTVGHPLMDLGTSLSYWVQADDPPELQMTRLGPTNIDGMATREQIAEMYGERTGRDLSKLDFYVVYGLFKTAVVGQQIYYRFKTGKTDDQRFAMFIHFVTLLSKKAAGIIEKSTL